MAHLSVSLKMIEEITLLVKIWLVIIVFGFVRNWTGGNTTIAVIVAGILIYIFVIKYPWLGASWLVLSNLMFIIFFIWILALIIPK